MPAITTPGDTGKLYDSDKLLAWRRESGLSRTAASHAAGMSYPWLADLEYGRARNPTIQALTRLAELYGHTLAELIQIGGTP